MPEKSGNRGGVGKERILLITLLALLIISLSYIAYTEYIRFGFQIAQEGFVIGYNQGIMDGVVDTVEKIHVETTTCQPIPIMYNNITKYIIDVECLQRPV